MVGKWPGNDEGERTHSLTTPLSSSLITRPARCGSDLVTSGSIGRGTNVVALRATGAASSAPTANRAAGSAPTIRIGPDASASIGFSRGHAEAPPAEWLPNLDQRVRGGGFGSAPRQSLGSTDAADPEAPRNGDQSVAGGMTTGGCTREARRDWRWLAPRRRETVSPCSGWVLAAASTNRETPYARSLAGAAPWQTRIRSAVNMDTPLPNGSGRHERNASDAEPVRHPSASLGIARRTVKHAPWPLVAASPGDKPPRLAIPSLADARLLCFAASWRSLDHDLTWRQRRKKRCSWHDRWRAWRSACCS